MLVNLYTDNAWYFAGIIPSVLIVFRCLIVYVITFFADKRQAITEKKKRGDVKRVIRKEYQSSTGIHSPVS